MSSFANLKKTQSQRLDALQGKLNDMKGKNYNDERFWTPTKDKAGNGYAVIRFLPPTEGETDAWVQVFSHSFQGPGGWYIENCPTTIGKPCPNCEANNVLWNTGDENNQKIVRTRKRKLNYISNIYVISDPGNPANNGKVFLFKYGAKIFAKLESSMEPKYPGQKKIDPFDFWTGRNFELKICQVAGFPNYDESALEASSQLLASDKDMEAVFQKQYKLAEFVEPSKFKSYDELASRFSKVLNTTAAVSTAQNTKVESDVEAPKRSFSKPAAAPKKVETAPFDATDEDDGDSLAMFKRLAEES